MVETQTVPATQQAGHPPAMTPADRKAHGKRRRDSVPRDAHTGWQAPADRADPIGILRAADKSRQPELVPLRYGRMLQSPFTFTSPLMQTRAPPPSPLPASGARGQAAQAPRPARAGRGRGPRPPGPRKARPEDRLRRGRVRGRLSDGRSSA
jgi:hypothetical protein